MIKLWKNCFRTRAVAAGLMLFVFTWPVLAKGDMLSNKRVKFNFNPGWKVMTGDPNGAESVDFDDSGWKKVTLPYAWNEDEAFKLDIHNLSTGIAWYRKSFKIPAVYIGQKVFLEFEGIRQAGEFYFNGQFIGRHENGVMAFGFDITKLVKFAPGVNVLAVRIDNSWIYSEKLTGRSYQWNDKNFNANYGGIVKNAYLHVTDKLYQTLPLFSTLGTTGVYIYAQDFNIADRTAQITAESEVRNEHPTAGTFEYEVVIQNMQGDLIKAVKGARTTISSGDTKTVKASATISDLEFWSWGYGYLYDVYTILRVNGEPVDIVRTRTGFRKTEFGNGMIKLNDRVIQVKGYAQRSSNEWPAVGLSVPPWMSDFSNRMIVEGNGNLVRWMHVTPWKQDVESCDRVGLMQAMPAGDSEKDASGRQWEQRVELMRDAIIYNRNNPSIVFYEGGNKAVSEAHIRELKQLRDRYDLHGGRAIGAREMLDSKLAEYGGEMLYINKSADKPMWAMEYSRDEGLRKYWDKFSPPYHRDGDGPTYRNAPAREYNRNQDSHAIENVIRWYDYWCQRPGTGKRVSSGGVNIIFSDTQTHYRGAENYRRSGEVDPMRIPKDGFFANQVMWDGWVDIERPHIHIIGHWNYAHGTKKNIYVVSNTEKVELFINGKSQGFGAQSYRFLFTFEGIEWKPGLLKAVGYDAGNNQLCQVEKRTAGEPDSIRLIVNTGPNGIRADGTGLALITVEVVDARGNRCPTAMNIIEFSLKGPAEWRGGIAQGPDNYILSKSLPVECGVNRVIIRSTTEAGKIRLTANSKGLNSASVEIDSKPVKVIDGLSLTMPDANMPCYLKRLLTPENPSFRVSRIPVNIAGATAGANSDQAGMSFDDNETTGWSSDGTKANAWIQYDFKNLVTVSEVVMKLRNWRTKSYSIEMFVGGRKVYQGDTPRSLGYVTITVEPVAGTNLTIALRGISKDKDAFNITELTGEKEQAGTTADKADDTLGIIEIEFYEKVSDTAAGTNQ
jgi:beta-galactosidase